MRVTKVNEYLYWTQAEYDRRPVLVVLADAPENQIAYAKRIEALAIWRVIYEA